MQRNMGDRDHIGDWFGAIKPSRLYHMSEATREQFTTAILRHFGARFPVTADDAAVVRGLVGQFDQIRSDVMDQYQKLVHDALNCSAPIIIKDQNTPC
jgi:hypothetical protein